MSQKDNIIVIQEFKPKLHQRRRYVSAVNTILRWVMFSLSIGLFYSAYLLFNLDMWNIKFVEINGLTKIGSAYVQKFEIDKTYKDKHLLLVNPLEIIRILKHDRIFKNISVKRSLFPPTIQINFVERKPYKIIYEKMHERIFTIDDQGFILTFNDQSNNKYIHIINEIKNYRISQEQIDIIKITSSFLERKKIQDIGIYDLSEIDKIILKTKTNTVFLGNIEDIIMKIKSIDELEKLSQKTKNELEYIDVSNWRNPVLKIKVKKKNSAIQSKKEDNK